MRARVAERDEELTMTEAEWFGWKDPRAFLQSLYYLGADPIRSAFSSRRLRLFAVACAVRVQSRNADPQLTRAIEAAEIAADTRTNAAWARYKELRRAIWMDEDWGRTSVGQLARALTSGKALTAAIQASWHACYLIGGGWEEREQERITQGPLLRDTVGNPLRSVAFPRKWRTDTAVLLARQMYESRDFGAIPILADALQEAGCDSEDILNHCRTETLHVRGCWVVDLVLGKS